MMMKKIKTTRLRWKNRTAFALIGKTWFTQMRKRKQTASHFSEWWDFARGFEEKLALIIAQLIEGIYVFEPLITYRFPTEVIDVWSFRDRLAIRFIYYLIQSTFKKIIPANCFHLEGASAVKKVIERIQTACTKTSYRYVIRADVASYYATIDRTILLNQVLSHFNDTRIISYLTQIIQIPIYDSGNILLPSKGIPIRSTMSPFFGALYLAELDRAFENREGIFYARYMDDVLLLAKTKRQFVRAKKRMKAIFKKLQLTFSGKKTRMGNTEGHFHFLGVNFELPRSDSVEQNHAVSTTLHPRSCRRALDKICAMEEDSTPVDQVLRYLSRWSAWWKKTVGCTSETLIRQWITFTADRVPELLWVGKQLWYALRVAAYTKGVASSAIFDELAPTAI